MTNACPPIRMAPDASRASARRRRDDRGAAQAPAAGTRVLAARARRSRRLLRLHLPDRGGYPPAFGEGAAQARRQARRLGRATSRRARISTSREAARAPARRPRARDPARREDGAEAALQAARRRGDRRRRPRVRAAGAGRARSSSRRSAARTDRRPSCSKPRSRDEPFSPVDKVDIYSQLGRAYAEAGRAAARGRALRAVRSTAIADGDGPGARGPLRDAAQLRAERHGRARPRRGGRPAARSSGSRTPTTRTRASGSTGRSRASRTPKAAQSVALANVRKAIALLQATDDTLHLARAHILAADITLSRDDADDAPTPPRQRRAAARAMLARPQDRVEISDAALTDRGAPRGGGAGRRARAARRSSWSATTRRSTDGLALSALADALVLAGDIRGGRRGVPREAVDLLEAQGRWRDAATTCRAWGRMLRDAGRRAAGAGRARARRRARHAGGAGRRARRALSVELALTPRGPYSLALSARFASDATRTFRDGVLTQALAVGGRDAARPGAAGAGRDGDDPRRVGGRRAARLRWLLALDDDHSRSSRARARTRCSDARRASCAGCGRCACRRSRTRCCARSAAS